MSGNASVTFELISMDYDIRRRSYGRTKNRINALTLETGFYVIISLFDQQYLDQSVLLIYT